MERTNKIRLSLLGVVAVSSVLMGVVHINLGYTAKAAVETEKTGITLTLGSDEAFFYLNGASIRVSEPTGFRYEATMSTADYEKVTAYEATSGDDVSFGIAVMPKEYVTQYGDLSEETMFGANANYYWLIGTRNGEKVYNVSETTGKTQIMHAADSELDTFTVNGVQHKAIRLTIKELNEGSYTHDFYAKPYVAITSGESTTYMFAGASDYDTRSVGFVAEKAYETEIAKETPNTDNVNVLKGFIQKSKGYTPIYTADELRAAISATDGVTYKMAKDIDLTGVTLPANTVSFTGNIDGNGYAIRNLSFAGTLFSDFTGTLKNVTVEATGSGESANLFYKISSNGNMENVYVDWTRDVENCTRAITRLFYQAGAQTGTVSVGSASLTNVLFNVSYINNSAVTAYYTRILNHFHNVNVDMNDVYAVDMSGAAGLLNERYGPIGDTAITVKNGNDDEYTIDKNTSSINYGAAYGFVSVSHFQKSAYAATFTADMWKDIIVYDEDEYYQIEQDNRAAQLAKDGYTAITTATELKTVLETEASSSKYYLANDIDMTGVSITSGKVFAGILDGNGHKVYNITYTNKLIGYFNGTWKNISFYATRTGTGEVGFISVARSSTMENVYIDLTLDVQNGSGSVYGGIIAETPNASVTINMTNVVANVHFANNSNNVAVGSDGFGLIWRLRGGTITMKNAYLVMEGLASNYYLAIVHNFYSTSTNSRKYSITNGADDAITATNDGAKTEYVKAGQKYCYLSMETFKDTEYVDVFTDILWNKVFKG